MVRGIEGIPVRSILLASVFTVANFAVWAAGEWLALSYAQRTDRVSAARAATVSFAALGVGHVVGLGPISSGAVRLRMYGRNGLGWGGVTRVLLFNGITVGAGLILAIGLLLPFSSDRVLAALGLSRATVLAAAVVAATLAVAYLVVCHLFAKREVKIRDFRLLLPSVRLAAGQLVVGLVAYLLLGATLHACLSGVAAADYPTVMALLAGAELTATISHVPGGWGLLESLFNGFYPGERALAALAMYRIVYFLAPFLLGLAIWAADEAFRRFNLSLGGLAGSGMRT